MYSAIKYLASAETWPNDKKNMILLNFERVAYTILNVSTFDVEELR